MEEWDEMQSSGRKYKKVLIAMDGSKYSVETFEWYVENIHRDTDIVILAYCPQHGNGNRLPSASSLEVTAPESQEAQTKRVFRSIEELGNRHRVRHILQLIHEPVGESIVKAANQQDVDLIITGSRRRANIGQMVGSTSNFITRFSHVPVMTYKYTGDPGSEHEQEFRRSRSESFGDQIKSIWRKEDDLGNDYKRQRSLSLSERMKAILF